MIQENQPLLIKEMLSFYTKYKCDINFRDSNECTVLHSACQERNMDERILTYLLDYPGIDVQAKNLNGNTPLHYFCEKFSSPSAPEYMDRFIQLGAAVNVANDLGETLVHKACLNNSIRIILVNYLISHGVDISVANHDGNTPLHFAVRMNREDLVTILLSAGADPGVRDRKACKTPLELAKEHPRGGAIYQKIKRVHDLNEWLASVDPAFTKYRVNFVKQEMYLDVLPMITEDILRDDVRISDSDLPAILEAIAKLAPPPAASPAPSASPGSCGGEPQESPLDARARAVVAGAEGWVIKSSAIEFVSKAGSAKSKAPEELGAGATAQVYRAIYQGRSVAAKILKSWTSESQVDEFRKEFDVMRALSGPYIVRFYGACLEPKLTLVMEYCERDTLCTVLGDRALDVGWPAVLRWAAEVAHAINTLHQHTPQVLHRDFKSLNVLVTSAWECRVCDFGLSCFNTSDAHEALAETCGTITHCAPEIFPAADGGDGDGEDDEDACCYTTKADVYSMGIVFWELVRRCVDGVYGKPWYSEIPNAADFMIVIKAQEGVRPSMEAAEEPVQGKVPPQVHKLYRAMVHKKPKRRPECSEVLEALSEMEKDYMENQERWDAYRKMPEESGGNLTKTLTVDDLKKPLKSSIDDGEQVKAAEEEEKKKKKKTKK